jgi:hypothetical protein
MYAQSQLLHEDLIGSLTGSQIISKSLEDLNYIRTLSSSVQRLILDALISSIETAFGTLRTDKHSSYRGKLTIAGISCVVLFISLVSMWFVRDISRTSPGLSFAA